MLISLNQHVCSIHENSLNFVNVLRSMLLEVTECRETILFRCAIHEQAAHTVGTFD